MAGVIKTKRKTFDYESWNPQREGRGEFKKRTLSLLADQIDQDRDDDGQGTKWHPVQGTWNLERDARWFVLYQFGGMRPSEIARLENETPDAADRSASATRVAKAVSRISRHLGLQKKTGKPTGRPPKR
jgi:hypothetical protein